ncbi:MAG: AraC family transcriptional regulator [Verrucomicrobia bacterium]|nr:AraC family transcriptional regulator [Verrucomicrobiota bacterium]
MRYFCLICANSTIWLRDIPAFDFATMGYRYLEVTTEDLRRELYLTSVGHAEFRPGDLYPEHGHPADYDFTWTKGRVLGDFAAVFIEKGGGLFETREVKMKCQAGDAFLIPPGSWHRYRPESATGWTERWICGNGEYLHRLRAKRRLGLAGTVNSACDVRRLLAAMRRTYRIVVKDGAQNSLATAGLGLEIFGLVSSTSSGEAPASDWLETGDRIVDSAREFIWLNSHRPLTVATIAARLGVSRRTLERRYSGICGQTVVRTLIERRVQVARQLLIETSMSVKEISYAVGFGDSRRLIRNFKQVFGQTPLSFRGRSA